MMDMMLRRMELRNKMRRMSRRRRSYLTWLLLLWQCHLVLIIVQVLLKVSLHKVCLHILYSERLAVLVVSGLTRLTLLHKVS